MNLGRDEVEEELNLHSPWISFPIWAPFGLAYLSFSQCKWVGWGSSHHLASEWSQWLGQGDNYPCQANQNQEASSQEFCEHYWEGGNALLHSGFAKLVKHKPKIADVLTPVEISLTCWRVKPIKRKVEGRGVFMPVWETERQRHKER